MIHWKEALAMMFGIEEHVTKAEENQTSFSTYSVYLQSYPDADGSFSGALHLQEWVFAGVYGVGFPQNHFFLAALTLRLICLVNFMIVVMNNYLNNYLSQKYLQFNIAQTVSHRNKPANCKISDNGWAVISLQIKQNSRLVSWNHSVPQECSLSDFIACIHTLVYHSPSWQGSESAYSEAYMPKELRKIKA